MCHLYLVHPPGGVVGGDHIELRAVVKEGAHALITTPAATKFYRSERRLARQVQHLQIAEDAICEWLPQETILFPACHASIATRVHLAATARFIGWEIVSYGRPASGLGFTSGIAHQDFELWLEDVPLVLDHLRLDGNGEPMMARYGLGGFLVLGTLIAYPATDEALRIARTTPANGVLQACTIVDGALICRAAAAHADAVRRCFVDLWFALRPHLIGRAAVPPRIWAT